MANIAQKVALIRQAIFGKDVRESIASGLEAMNTETENTTARQNVIDGQEQTRIDAENVRISDENDRENKEDIRKSNETIRIANEDIRKSNEITRQSQEMNRVNTFNVNESNRQTSFQSSETLRQNTFNNSEENRQIQYNALKTDLTESIDNANKATLNTNTATSNYTDVVEQTNKIYKPIVGAYSDIATTYPNPKIGWTTVAKDTHLEYRWDGSEWVNIGVSDVFDGYNIVIGSTPPNNPNLIWIDAPENTRYSRVVPSINEPTDIGQIWWELDN